MKRIGDLMKKLFIVPLFLILLACGSSVPVAESTVGITAPDGFAAACVTGYTRTLPHFCAKDVVTASVSLTNDSTCRTLVPDAVIPTVAKYVEVLVNVSVASGNAIAQRTVAPVFYLTAGCASNIQQWGFTVREAVAVASQVLWQGSFTAKLKLDAGNVYYISDDGVSTITIQLISAGYYD